MSEPDFKPTILDKFLNIIIIFLFGVVVGYFWAWMALG